MSSHDGEDDAAAQIDAGADEYIEQPPAIDSEEEEEEEVEYQVADDEFLPRQWSIDIILVMPVEDLRS